MRDALVTDMHTVCTLDPAIDHVASSADKFADTRDLAHLVERPGMRSTTYTLRPIGAQMMTTWVDAATSQPERWRRAFQVAVREIHNVPHEDPRSTGVDPVWQPTHPMRLADGEMLVWKESAIDELARRLDLAHVYEIGCVAYERAFLGKALARGAAIWSLPPSSRAVLDRMSVRRAAQIQSDALMVSEGKSSKSTGPNSAPNSDARGDATAMASDGATSPPA